MDPISPVVPGKHLPEVVFAKDQPQYRVLPAFKDENGVVLSRWKMSWKERLVVLLRGDLYLQVMTFGNPLQPLLPSVEPPKFSDESSPCEDPLCPQ